MRVTVSLAALLMVWAPMAAAADVYINGTNVEGLANQSFEKVNVTLDEKGNVHIEAPGYSVKRVTIAPTPETPANQGIISQKYFLVTEQTPDGATEYDIDFFLNGKLVRTMKSGDDQLISELTHTLRPGRNQVLLQAKKHLATPGEPRTTAKSAVFRVIVGEGKSTADQVIIDKPIITFTRTAADQNDVTQEFTLVTR
jgi:hypothetical protein